MTRILLTPLVQDDTGLAARHGRVTAVPYNGTFRQTLAWDFEPYTDPTIELDPPPIGSAWDLTLTIGASTSHRIVTFIGAAVDWDHLTDVDPSTMQPVPTGPGVAIWDSVRADLLAAVQVAREDLDGYLEAHIMDPTPHAAYDDMPDLTLLFENKVVTGIVDDANIPDLTTVFDNTI